MTYNVLISELQTELHIQRVAMTAVSIVLYNSHQKSNYKYFLKYQTIPILATNPLR